LRFTGIDHGLDPGEKALTHRGRSVFAVGMLDFGSIDEVVTGSEERKE